METTRFGIWKRGYTDFYNDYHPSALIKICESKKEAEEKLKDYDSEHFIEPY